jgi:hypothetical protein
MGKFGLSDWEEVANRRDWPILLHGNGASCAVSHRFAYPSLYQAAPLTPDDRDVFSSLRTTTGGHPGERAERRIGRGRESWSGRRSVARCRSSKARTSSARGSSTGTRSATDHL